MPRELLSNPLLWLSAVILLSDGVDVIDATLPQASKLRRRPHTKAIIYHTTGGGLAKVAAAQGAPLSVAYDEAAVNWYRRSGMKYFGHMLVTPRAAVYRLAPDDAWCIHSASLPQDGGPMPPKWWRRRWPGLQHPVQLLGRHISVRTYAIDLLPMPGKKKFTPAQLRKAAELGAEKGAMYGLQRTRQRHLGHEDVDPIRRGVPRPWDPGFNWAQFMRHLKEA